MILLFKWTDNAIQRGGGGGKKGCYRLRSNYFDLDIELSRSIDLDNDIYSIDRSRFRANSISSCNSVNLDLNNY